MLTTRSRRAATTLVLLAAIGTGVSACSSSDASDDSAVSPTATTSAGTQTTTTGAIPLSSGSLGSGSLDPAGVTPPFIDHVQWVQTPQGPSLQVVPTPNGRVAQAPADMGEAWGEVVKKDPKADTPGMQAQFDCHWRFARIVQPNKPSWNLEPWRPVATDDEMVMSQCNPGGPEI